MGSLEGEFANVKRVILAHFTLQLTSDPIADHGPSSLIQPSTPLNLADHPSFLALFREHPPKASIIRGSPKGVVKKEERPRNSSRQSEE
jgi:hypothetical protein